MKKRPYTVSEVSEIKALIFESKLTRREIAERLGRSVGSLDSKVFNLGLRSGKGRDSQKKSRYRADEVDRLEGLVAKTNLNIRAMASAIGRSKASVTQKLWRMGVSLKEERAVLDL